VSQSCDNQVLLSTSFSTVSLVLERLAVSRRRAVGISITISIVVTISITISFILY